MKSHSEHARRETLYGRQAVRESLRAGRRTFYKLTLADSAWESEVIAQTVALAERAGATVRRIPRLAFPPELSALHHQGVALEASPYPYTPFDELLDAARPYNDPPLLLLLDLLQDPQNVGSLLRTAEAVGVCGVILQERRAVGITPAVVHASAGAVEHLPIAQVTNLVSAIEALKMRDVWVAGLEATGSAQPYHRADLRGALALVVGSEGEGLRRLVRERCDFLVQLPMLGQIASLNAAVAGSVVLYEALRQRRGEEGKRGRQGDKETR